MLVTLAKLVEGLVVYPENMKRNLALSLGLWNSQTVLLALIKRGLTREEAYELVQRNAMKVWRGEGDFLTFLKADPDIRTRLAESEIVENFDLNAYLRHVDLIFSRVFGEAQNACGQVRETRESESGQD